MKRLLLAIASGLLLALGWPTYGFPLLLFFGFIPLLLVEHAIRTSNGRYKKLRLFGFSYLSFFIWNFITTNWLQFADVFGASFAILVNAMLMSFLILIYHSVAKRTSKNRSLLFLITLWICFEKLHLGWEFSWPWLNLGNGFSEYTSWIQWYEYTGTFGGTLWVWIVNVIGFSGFLKYQTKTSNRSIYKTGIQIFSIILIPILISQIIYHTYTNKGEAVNIVILQPNIDPYNEKYEATNTDFSTLFLKLASKEVTDKTDFIIAPETFFADNVKIELLQNSVFKYKLDHFVQEHPNVNLISGISLIRFIYDEKDVKPQSNAYGDHLWYDDFNSAMLINSSDSLQLYHKSKLVVGVENFPYQGILKPLIGTTMIDLGGTVAMKTTQEERSVFTSSNGKFKAAPIICYESVYGEFVTGYVRNGANFLTIITNDAWWGKTQGHLQHLSLARLRAIETRRSIARSANTGISAFIDQRGDIISTLAYDTQGTLTATIRTNEAKTFYVMAGDYIARISMFIAVFVFLISFFRRKTIK